MSTQCLGLYDVIYSLFRYYSMSYTYLSLSLHSQGPTKPHLIDRDTWILDFEATDHMTPLNSIFQMYEPCF